MHLLTRKKKVEDQAESQTQAGSKSVKEKKTNVKSQVAKAKEPVFKHKLLATCLKAHSDRVNGIDFSSNGKYLLSCGNGSRLLTFVLAFDIELL